MPAFGPVVGLLNDALPTRVLNLGVTLEARLEPLISLHEYGVCVHACGASVKYLDFMRLLYLLRASPDLL